MSEERNYGIIREQGEFMEPSMLSEEDNKTVNEADEKEKDDRAVKPVSWKGYRLP